MADSPDNRTLTLASLVRDMARELPDGNPTKDQASAYLVASGLSEVRVPHPGGYPVETVIRVLSTAPAHGKLRDEVERLQLAGDIIHVNEGDFWMMLMCASQAATMLSAVSAPITEVSPMLPPQATLGRFGHDADPAVDYCREIDVIHSLVATMEEGAGDQSVDRAELDRRIDRAFDFSVGGNPDAVDAKRRLRDLAARLDARQQAPLSDITQLVSKLAAALPENHPLRDLASDYVKRHGSQPAGLARFGNHPDGHEDFRMEVEKLLELQILHYTQGEDENGNAIDPVALGRRIDEAMTFETGDDQDLLSAMAILKGVAMRHSESQRKQASISELSDLVSRLAGRLDPDDALGKEAVAYLATHDADAVPFRTSLPKIKPERLAALTVRHSLMSSAMGRDISLALVELSLRRSVDRMTGQKGLF